MAEATFEQDIEARVPALQDLLAGVIERFCGHGDASITQISDRLGVHRKLAWQIRNVAYSRDPFRAVCFMPSPAGLASLDEALASIGLEESERTRLRQAGEEFNELVTRHAGDRAVMEMLVDSFSDEAAQQSEVKWRERAYEGNSFIWGARARTQLSISAMSFSRDKADWFDIMQVRGLIGLTRLRRDVHWLVGQSVVLSDEEQASQPHREPLDPISARQTDGVPVLGDFCSQPLPKLRRVPGIAGLVNDELLPAPVGSTGQQTIMTGEIIRELSPIYATEANKRALFGAVVRTPSEVFVFDQYVHRDLFPDVERELCVFGELNSPVTQSDSDRLPVSETIEHLGRGVRAGRTKDVAGYTELVRDVFDRVEWNVEEFDLFRIRMAYPPMPASVVIRHDFPERPGN